MSLHALPYNLVGELLEKSSVPIVYTSNPVTEAPISITVKRDVCLVALPTEFHQQSSASRLELTFSFKSRLFGERLLWCCINVV